MVELWFSILGDPNAPRPGLIDRFNNWMVATYFELLADLTEDVEPTETQEEELAQLTVKQCVGFLSIVSIFNL